MRASSTTGRTVAVIATILGPQAGSVRALAHDANPTGQVACRAGSTDMGRVELYFGAGRATRRDWSAFLARVVTPRFPDGFTSLDGRGQWRGPRGLSRERTHVLVIFYRRDGTSDARIEAIRSAYRRAFAQTSVLRADVAACVGF